jgi:hypothetical protein
VDGKVQLIIVGTFGLAFLVLAQVGELLRQARRVVEEWKALRLAARSCREAQPAPLLGPSSARTGSSVELVNRINDPDDNHDVQDRGIR